MTGAVAAGVVVVDRPGGQGDRRHLRSSQGRDGAAVDAQHGAADVPATGAHEERGEVGDLLGLGDARQGLTDRGGEGGDADLLVAVPGREVRDESGGRVGAGQAGRDDVAADAVAAARVCSSSTTSSSITSSATTSSAPTTAWPASSRAHSDGASDR